MPNDSQQMMLMRLRVELYGAAQLLKGEELADFTTLISEIAMVLNVEPRSSNADLGWRHYPVGMGEESRRLHREYNALVAAQRQGARNGADVVRLTDECAVKNIVLVPGGENL